MLKFVTACLVLFVYGVARNNAAITDDQKIKIQTQMITVGLECVKDHPLKFDHLKVFRDRKIPDDEDAKCFVKCIFANLGIMEDNGKLSEEKAKKNAREVFGEGDEILPIIDEIIEKCVKVNDRETKDGDKGCDRAKMAFKCFAKFAPKAGLDIDF